MALAAGTQAGRQIEMPKSPEPGPDQRDFAMAAALCDLVGAQIAAASGADDSPSVAASPAAISSLGMAGAATTLFCRLHKFDAADPHWPDRDRLVVSSASFAPLLYALLHLTGHDGMTVDDLARFRQLGASAAALPAFGNHPAIEATAGAPGQAFAAAAGMALAERMLAARFGRSLVDHRTWVLASTADLTAGVGHEAGGIAGQLRLDKLTVLWLDEQEPPADADAPGDEVLRRFAAYGWATRRVSASDQSGLGAALSQAARSKRPTLIAIEGANAESPARVASWDVPADIAADWTQAGQRGAASRRSWLKRLARHAQRDEFERVVSGRLPDNFHDALALLKAEIVEHRAAGTACAASLRVTGALSPAMPELVGGGTDQAADAASPIRGMACVTSGAYAGRFVRFGLRESGMAAALNGMALHGGIVAFGAGCLVGSDAIRPALRLAATMRRRVVHLLARDAIGHAADGPPEQPADHLSALRAIAGLHVFRPACALETAESWELALRRADGPSVIALHTEPREPVRLDPGENLTARGGYLLAKAPGVASVTLIASGPEVGIALAARDLLSEAGIQAAVVSLPCWDLFALQAEDYRTATLGASLRVGIEATTGFGWERWLGAAGMFIGLNGFAPSGPSSDVYKHFSITAEGVAAAVRRRLASAA